MIFRVFPAGIFQANCYIIGDDTSGAGAVVDPGGDPSEIISQCESLGIKIEKILLTHGHGDHIGGASEIREKTGARIYINKKDEYLIKGATRTLIPILRNIKLFDADEFIGEGDIIEIGNIKVLVLETPGHTPGGISFKIGNMVLTGDALFKGSIGRTDFEFGSQEILIESIKEKLMTLPDDTRIFPGHGPSTTVEEERLFNPFLR